MLCTKIGGIAPAPSEPMSIKVVELNRRRKSQRQNARAALAPGARLRRATVESPDPEPREAAESAGLRYVSDTMAGLRRLRVGKGFRYVTPQGSTVRDKADLERIRSLAIPPAWRDVSISPHARGHLQATGRDARGRKQYRYHPKWREIPDDAKYGRMLEFAAALPGLRRRTAADLSVPGLSRRKVVAAVVQLLEKTLIRVGNDEYARDNQSFGLTTMRDGHARVSRSTIRFRFKGKSGKFHDITFSDARLAKIVHGDVSSCPAGSCSSTSMTMARSRTLARRTSTTTCATSRAARSRPRISERGLAPSWLLVRSRR